MSADNPFRDFVAAHARLIAEGRGLVSTNVGRPAQPVIAADAPKVLLFSPHPDDECLTGALPLRLRREAAMDVVNVAVTLGSDPRRQAERWLELQDACAWLGFGVRATTENGLTRINPQARLADPRAWQAAVELLVAILAAERPEIVFVPHAGDRHPTHVGTHLLVFDALAALDGPNPQWIVETEYWGQLEEPNLMVCSSVADVADLVAALACHRGEVARNAYHLALPAGMIDAVRRGAEVVRGHGAAAPAGYFATLYRVSRRSTAGLIEAVAEKRILAEQANAASLFIA